jgi:PBS lyase HEAT-like repeat-containing protein
MSKKIKPNFLLNTSIWKIIFFGVILVGFIVVMIFVIGSVWIGHGVQTECKLAIKEFNKSECVQALLVKVQADNIVLAEKNKAVWTLGQLGDEQALPILKSLYTGEKCDHEKFLCQYELKKAIELLEGGFNVTRLVRKD